MAITASNWGWRHAGRQAWAVRHLDLRVDQGERVLLLGPSGSGKSTLLHALAGVLGPSEGEQDGTLLVDGAHPTRVIGHCGLVLQDPESSVVLGQVGDDVAFGLENLQVPREQIWPRVRQALDQVGLDVDLDHSTSALSGGQQQRLALAGALAMGANTLLLDEPTANLDPEGITEITSAIDQVLDADPGRTLVVVEHRVDIWLPVIDRIVVFDDPHREGFDPQRPVLADGQPEQVLAQQRQALLAAGVWLPSEPLPRPRLAPAPEPEMPEPKTDWALRTVDLTIGRDRPLHQHLNLAIPSGTSTVLTGPNGAGKSTLALTLAGLLAPLAGRVEADPELRPPRTRPARGLFGRRHHRDPSNPADWRSRDLITRIGSVFQHPEHQFVAATVRDELAVGLHALASDPEVPADQRLDEQAIDQRVETLLHQLRLDRLARANPFTLSGGEKRRLSVATVLATSPSVIILDEPTFGQDRNTWSELVAILQQLVAQGRTLLSVTHDPAFIEALGQHRLHLDRTSVQVIGS